MATNGKGKEMNAEEARKFDALERELNELRDKFNRLAHTKDDDLESLYPPTLDTSVTSAVPWWVREMIESECSDAFSTHSEEKFYGNRLSYGHIFRFALYYAVMYPERIEYVSMDMLRRKKSVIDGI